MCFGLSDYKSALLNCNADIVSWFKHWICVWVVIAAINFLIDIMPPAAKALYKMEINKGILRVTVGGWVLKIITVIL